MLSLGQELDMQNKFKEAIGQYSTAIELKSDDPAIHNLLGITLFKTGRADEALQQFRHALLLNPNYPEAETNLGNVLLSMKRPGEAIEYFRRALRIEPDSSGVHNSLGVAPNHTGQPLEAIGHFNQALQLAPDSIESHYNLALSYAALRPIQGSSRRGRNGPAHRRVPEAVAEGPGNRELVEFISRNSALRKRSQGIIPLKDRMLPINRRRMAHAHCCNAYENA